MSSATQTVKNALSKISLSNFSWGAKVAPKPVYTPPEKRGEINELRQALSDPSLDKDQNKKREVLQKVIWYVTMGLDTSKLFDKMILFVNTKDVVQKKMVYQYVTHYCHTNPDLALMAINSLSRDCRDESPLIRGLALRTLSLLRLPKIVEHLLPLIKEGLNDPSPYVRKTAVISVMKLNKIAPKIVEGEKFVDRLYSMIRDKDVQVVINSILAINEIEEITGGLIVTKKMAEYLLNRIFEYNEWQLCVILDVLVKYKPESANEVLNIMNLLDDSLQLANAAIVMGIASVFLRFTENMPKIHSKVFARLKDPMLLLYATAPHELAYSILCHIKLMASRSPIMFAPHYKDFFIRHNDPTYLKCLKLEVLTIVAVDVSVSEIMNEISFYVTISDNDMETSRRAIRALGEIAVKLSNATEQSLTYLLDFLDMDISHVLNETFIVLKDILRKYRNNDFCSTYLPQITKHWRSIEDPNALVSFIWILGEFGAFIRSAPYILETYIDTFDKLHYAVRLQLLTASTKLFFGRAPEMQKMLGRLFEAAIQDASHADVHDRALFYYRLLKTDTTISRQVICSAKTIVSSFTEEESPEHREKLFVEFNSLSVVYAKPSERFIITGPAVLGAEMEEEDEDEEDEEEEEEDEEDEEGEQSAPEYRMKQRLLDVEEETFQQTQPKQKEVGLLDETFGVQPPSQQTQARTPPFPLMTTVKPLMPGDYQAKWQTSKAVKNFSFTTKTHPNPSEVEQLVKAYKVMCIAASKNEPAMFYLYAQKDKADEYFLLECKFYQTGKIDCTVKNDKNNSAELDTFFEYFKAIFARFM